MDSLIYTSASGVRDLMITQSLSANNLANASTPGFRADLDHSQSKYLTGQGLDSRVFSAGQQQVVDLSEGSVKSTGRSLDFAVNGDGWIAVIGELGTEGYSRRGDLRVDELGQLINGAGDQILGDAGPIALPPFSELEIGTDGTISIVPVGEGPATLAVVDRIKLVNLEPAGLRKSEDGLIRQENDEIAPADASVRLISGSLESSNVNPITSMVEMIELSRRFEHQIKMMSMAEELDESSTQLMRLN